MVIKYDFSKRLNTMTSIIYASAFTGIILFFTSFINTLIFSRSTKLFLSLITFCLLLILLFRYIQLNRLSKNYHDNILLSIDDSLLSLSLIEYKSFNFYKIPITSIKKVQINLTTVIFIDKYSSVYKIDIRNISKKDYEKLSNFIRDLNI